MERDMHTREMVGALMILWPVIVGFIALIIGIGVSTWKEGKRGFIIYMAILGYIGVAGYLMITGAQ